MESMEFEVYEGEARWGGEARYGIAHAILLPVAIHQIEGGKPVFRSISPPAEPPPFMK